MRPAVVWEQVQTTATARCLHPLIYPCSGEKATDDSSDKIDSSNADIYQETNSFILLSAEMTILRVVIEFYQTVLIFSCF